jgi:2-succinyl-5-enolpyruvyl-6-hydroxy-3-cyclohexene-1-carboxylate synthase
MSSLIGASLADPDRLFYLVTGDLAFFYDMNALGSRHLGSNVRILLVNNGKGIEFTQYGHRGSQLGQEADHFIAADGHFGQMSRELVKGYAEALGIEYIAVSDKNEAEAAAARLFSSSQHDRPMLVEAFVLAEDESQALKMLKNLDPSRKQSLLRQKAKEVLGPAGIKTVKRLLGD